MSDVSERFARELQLLLDNWHHDATAELYPGLEVAMTDLKNLIDEYKIKPTGSFTPDVSGEPLCGY